MAANPVPGRTFGEPLTPAAVLPSAAGVLCPTTPLHSAYGRPSGPDFLCITTPLHTAQRRPSGPDFLCLTAPTRSIDCVNTEGSGGRTAGGRISTICH